MSPVTLTATERARREAQDREDTARADRDAMRAYIGGVALRSAAPGRYLDVDGIEWTRLAAGKGAVAHPPDGDVPWSEGELPDVDDTSGPFRKQAGAGGKS